MLIDQIEAACRERGLPTDLPDRHVVAIGNGMTQFHTCESRAGRLVRQLEEHLRINPTGLLGDRFKRIQS